MVAMTSHFVAGSFPVVPAGTTKTVIVHWAGRAIASASRELPAYTLRGTPSHTLPPFVNSTFTRVSSEMLAMTLMHPKNLIRPLVHQLHAYVPGEQPKIKGLIKLNTNENPYPPSPNVLRAIKAAVDGRLRLYPNPTAEKLRAKLASLHR